MRLPLIAGNWKMNTTVEEAIKLARSLLAGLGGIGGVEKLICPPFVALASVAQIVQDTTVSLGAQNMHSEEKGAFTGEISPVMLSSLCRYVILGHSERRQYFAESDEFINKKVRAAFKFGLKPILCIGEILTEMEAGDTEKILDRQIRVGLNRLEASPSLVIAYEPVWAIGTGKAATAQQANATIGFIRSALTQIWGKELAKEIRILYGGSVSAKNISELVAESDIDGALVGGASLKTEEFTEIVGLTAIAKGRV